MYDTLFVQIYEPFEDLRDVHGDEVLWELAEPFNDVVQRAVLAEPGGRVSNTVLITP